MAEERLPVLVKKDFMPGNQILYGIVSGAIGKIAEYPLDTLKVRLQAQSITEEGVHFDGAVDCLKRSIRQDGLMGLYKGLTVPLYSCILETSISFLSYTYFQSLLGRKRNQNGALDSNNHDLSLTELALCGALSGIPVSLFITPFELVKCRIQNSYEGSNPKKHKSGILAEVSSVLKDKSYKTLYRGYPAILAREIGGGAAWFGVYELVAKELTIIHRFSNKTISHTKNDLSFLEIFVSGACAGIFASVCVYPFDVVKCIQQTDQVHRGAIRVARELLKFEGVKGLYRGLGICLIRSSLSSGATLGSYELLQRKINLGF